MEAGGDCGIKLRIGYELFISSGMNCSKRN